LIMSGDIQGGYDIIVNEIRTRAGYSALTSPALPTAEYDALKLLLNERQREFVGEGKRWFDILRIAKRNDYKYKEYLLEVLLANISAKEYETWKAKLSDPNSYYLPIHKDEIDNGRGILNQNPYYQDKE
ncbi:MAG: RagB/SusD family nutrient uptake outer membrane protein, partial [Odoribacter sp.]|nr:RagB/SusD family nutrient uptake outer membrane protein [Odoribacter sp.]